MTLFFYLTIFKTKTFWDILVKKEYYFKILSIGLSDIIWMVKSNVDVVGFTMLDFLCNRMFREIIQFNFSWYYSIRNLRIDHADEILFDYINKIGIIQLNKPKNIKCFEIFDDSVDLFENKSMISNFRLICISKYYLGMSIRWGKKN